MSYITETETSYGRKEWKVDLPRFAADLAKALDALLTSTDVKLLTDPAQEFPNERQTIRVGTDNLNIHANNWKRRVTASIAAPEVPWDDRNTYDKTHRTEDASINPDGRKIESIARDLNKRVIEASQEALVKQREHAANMRAGRASIVRLADALKERLPALSIRTNEKEQRAAIYNGGDGHYLSATLMSDGTVAIDRIGSIPVDTFAKIVTILNGKGAAR